MAVLAFKAAQHFSYNVPACWSIPGTTALPCLYKRVSSMPRERLGSASLKKKKKIIQQQRKNKLNNLHLLDKQLVRSQGISVSFLQSFPQFFFFFFCKDAVCLCLSFFPFVLLRLSSLCFGKQTRDSYLKHHFFIQKLKSSCLNSALLAL